MAIILSIGTAPAVMCRDWLEWLHRRVDVAILDAYGWPHNLTDEEILERLLALNLERVEEEKMSD